MPYTSNNPLDLLVWMCRQVVEFIKDSLWFCQSEQTKASEVLAEQLREITSDCPPENLAVIQKLADGILMGLCLSYESRVYTGDFIYYGRTPFFIRNYVELALHQHTKSSHAFTHRIKQAFNLS